MASRAARWVRRGAPVWSVVRRSRVRRPLGLDGPSTTYPQGAVLGVAAAWAAAPSGLPSSSRQEQVRNVEPLTMGSPRCGVRRLGPSSQVRGTVCRCRGRCAVGRPPLSAVSPEAVQPWAHGPRHQPRHWSEDAHRPPAARRAGGPRSCRRGRDQRSRRHPVRPAPKPSLRIVDHTAVRRPVGTRWEIRRLSRDTGVRSRSAYATAWCPANAGAVHHHGYWYAVMGLQSGVWMILRLRGALEIFTSGALRSCSPACRAQRTSLRRRYS